MLVTVGVGAALIVLVTCVHMAGLLSLAKVLSRRGRASGPGMMLLVITVLWLTALHTLEALIWALVYLVLGEFSTLEAALYFSATTASTLGYGDITLSPSWRLLATFEATGGMILFGASTAFLLGVMKHLFDGKDEAGPS